MGGNAHLPECSLAVNETVESLNVDFNRRSLRDIDAFFEQFCCQRVRTCRRFGAFFPLRGLLRGKLLQQFFHALDVLGTTWLCLGLRVDGKGREVDDFNGIRDCINTSDKIAEVEIKLECQSFSAHMIQTIGTAFGGIRKAVVGLDIKIDATFSEFRTHEFGSAIDGLLRSHELPHTHCDRLARLRFDIAFADLSHDQARLILARLRSAAESSREHLTSFCLNLSFADNIPSDSMSLLPAWTTFPHLHDIDLNFTRCAAFGDAGVCRLFGFATEPLGNDTGAGGNIGCIRSPLRRVRLTFSQIRLRRPGVQALCAFLAQLPCLQDLDFDLSYNELDDECAQMVGDLLRNDCWPQLQRAYVFMFHNLRLSLEARKHLKALNRKYSGVVLLIC